MAYNIIRAINLAPSRSAASEARLTEGRPRANKTKKEAPETRSLRLLTRPARRPFPSRMAIDDQAVSETALRDQ